MGSNGSWFFFSTYASIEAPKWGLITVATEEQLMKSTGIIGKSEEELNELAGVNKLFFDLYNSLLAYAPLINFHYVLEYDSTGKEPFNIVKKERNAMPSYVWHKKVIPLLAAAMTNRTDYHAGT